MRFGPGARVVVGLALAAAAIALLQWCVAERGDAGSRPPIDAGDVGPLLPDPVLPIGEAVTIALVHDRAALADGTAPVVEVGRGGAVRLLVAAPPPPGPVPAPWPVGGIVLPQPALAALDARERARLLQILAAWGGADGIGRDQLRWLGVTVTGAEIDALLRWLR